MDKLNGKQLEDACKVLDERYKRCTKDVLVKEVLSNQSSPMRVTEVCGPIFLQLDQYCLSRGVFPRNSSYEQAKKPS